MALCYDPKQKSQTHMIADRRAAHREQLITARAAVCSLICCVVLPDARRCTPHQPEQPSTAVVQKPISHLNLDVCQNIVNQCFMWSCRLRLTGDQNQDLETIVLKLLQCGIK